MLRVLVAICLASLVASWAGAQSCTSNGESRVRMGFANAEVTDLMKLYQSLTKRKVWIDAQLRFDSRVSLIIHHDVSQAEAISLIRDELRKQGVEIREVGDSEAYISRAAP